MPDYRERIANFLSPREPVKEIKVDQEIAYSESLFNSGSTAYKYDPDRLRSRKGHDIYSRMMFDEQVKAVVRFRRDAITGREYFFQYDITSEVSDSEKEMRVRLFDNILDTMKGSFTDALNAVMSGVWQGYSLTEKVHSVIEFEGSPYVGLSSIKKKPYETFRFNVDEYGNILNLEQDMDGHVRKIPIDKMIHYVQNPDIDEHYGGSELREAYRSWFSKDVAIKFWNIYLERSAGGVWVARAKDGHTIVNGSAEYSAILNVLGSLSASSSVLLPSSIELEHILPNSTSEYRDAIQFHDLSIAKSLLVPNLLGISHTGQTGSFSQSQTQFKSFMLVLESDTVRLESVLNEQLFRELGEVNFADGKYPKFRFKPLNIDQIIEMLTLWNELVGKDTVEPSDTDEAHIRKLLDMPEKGEPLPRRQPAVGQPISEQPDQQGGKPDDQNPEANAQNPDQLDAARDRVAWKATFTRALKRVRFAVIDRQSTTEIQASIDRLSMAIEKIVASMVLFIAENDVGTSAGTADDIKKVRINASQKNRVKTVTFKSLEKGWQTGQRHAQDEISAAQKKPFSANMDRLGDIASDYFDNKSFQIAGNLTAEIEALIRNILSNGLKYSRTTQEIVDSIYLMLTTKGVVKWEDAWAATSMTEEEFQEALLGAGLTPHRLETVVRTNYFEAVNEARFSYFTDPLLGGFVEALEYSAILDARTTAICSHLDGRIFDTASSNWESYRPPNHYNCRSLLIAVTENDTWKESRDPSLEPQSGFS